MLPKRRSAARLSGLVILWFRRRETELPIIAQQVSAGIATLSRWIASEPAMEWSPPTGGVVAFPRIRARSGVDTSRFYAELGGTHKTMVGPGHWFEHDDRYMRIGFGWPTPTELASGLACVSAALAAARV